MTDAFLVLCFYHTESQRIHGRGNIFECTSADAHGSAAVRGIWQTCWVMRITAAGLSVSFCIEFLQLVLKRGLFEWDDMIHNTLGVYLGCWICKKIMDVCKKR